MYKRSSVRLQSSDAFGVKSEKNSIHLAILNNSQYNEPKNIELDMLLERCSILKFISFVKELMYKNSISNGDFEVK